MLKSSVTIAGISRTLCQHPYSRALVNSTKTLRSIGLRMLAVRLGARKHDLYPVIMKGHAIRSKYFPQTINKALVW